MGPLEGASLARGTLESAHCLSERGARSSGVWRSLMGAFVRAEMLDAPGNRMGREGGGEGFFSSS